MKDEYDDLLRHTPTRDEIVSLRDSWLKGGQLDVPDWVMEIIWEEIMTSELQAIIIYGDDELESNRYLYMAACSMFLWGVQTERLKWDTSTRPVVKQ